jgi:hypothetical protein
MATTAIPGVVAAGRVPTWIIPAALVTVDPTTGANSIPLSVLNHATTVKIDCHMDAGDVGVTRTPTTKSRQRLCQVVAETVSTGETIDVTISAVYDQQAAGSATVNEAYTAMPKGAEVYIAQAFGWDSAATPTTATKIDLLPGTVQARTKTQPTTIDEDLKFQATISARAYFEDVTLTA